MTNKANNILSFSKERSEVKFIRYIFRYGYFGIILVIFFIIFDDSISESFDSWPFMIIFITCVIGANLSLAKFVQRLDLKFNDKKIVFYKFLNDRQIEVNFNDISKVSVGLYIKFNYTGGTLWFNEARNKSLIKVLEENFVVHKDFKFNLLKFFDK